MRIVSSKKREIKKTSVVPHEFPWTLFSANSLPCSWNTLSLAKTFPKQKGRDKNFKQSNQRSASNPQRRREGKKKCCSTEGGRILSYVFERSEYNFAVV